MKIRVLFASLVLGITGITMTASPASADEAGDAQAFIQSQYGKLTTLLKQPAGAGRDSQLTAALDTFVDYDELARRSFGVPCPAAVANCTNHWKDLTDAQKTEVRGLLKQLVAKNYRKNLLKTMDYDVSYKGSKATQGDSKVRTEAKSKVKPRDPAVQVDYLVHANSGNLRVVDIVTEGSSLTKNYYDQFHKMLTTSGQGYPYIVKKLNEKLAKN